MIEGFEDLNATKAGRIAEELSRRWMLEARGCSIKEDSCKAYDIAKDFEVTKEHRSFLVEVKGDSYRKGRNIALEYMQEALDRSLKPSGMQTTESEYILYYVFRWDRLYIFRKDKYDAYLSKGIISQKDSKDCNLSSDTGMTKCYILDALILEADGFFEAIIDNLNSSLR